MKVYLSVHLSEYIYISKSPIKLEWRKKNECGSMEIVFSMQRRGSFKDAELRGLLDEIEMKYKIN